MTEPTDTQPAYAVRVYEPADAPADGLVLTFVPKRRGPNGSSEPPGRVPQYIVVVRGHEHGLAFDWGQTPDDPGAARAEIEREAAQRANARAAWVERVANLVGQVEQWATELGWSTRRIDKRLDDSYIGTHRVPALLMQEDTCRILLEPVGRSTPGTEGVVDLYVMPAYDDIAGLYYHEGRWNLHHLSSGDRPAATVREAQSVPLSREALASVLAVLRQNAA